MQNEKVLQVDLASFRSVITEIHEQTIWLNVY